MENRFLNLFLVILFSLLCNLSAQLNFKLNLESGFYSDSLTKINNNIRLLNRLEGNAKYNYYHENTESSISVRLGSEFFKNDTRSFKLKSVGSYIYSQKNVVWKANINFNRFAYNYDSSNSVFNNFTLIAGAELNYFEGCPLNFLIGFSSQNVEYLNSIDFDLMFLDLTAVKPINNYSSIIYGIYIQNFASENKLRNNSLKSFGWNFGPQVKINYLKNIVFNLDYKFLLYSSNNTEFPSYEHQIEIVGGVILEKKISVFFLTDLLIRKLTFHQNISEENYNLILPSKNEN